MEFKKKIIGPKDKSVKWELRNPKSTLILHGDMSEHLGACVSHTNWAWTDKDVVMSAPNAEEFAKKLETKVNLEYANWFRGELGLSKSKPEFAEESLFLEFENLKVQIRLAKNGMFPIIHKQEPVLGNFLRTEKSQNGVKFKAARIPEILANTFYLGGIDSSGRLDRASDQAPDQKSKTPEYRKQLAVSHLAALEALGKKHPDKFGPFISTPTAVPESPDMTDLYIIEFENLKAIFKKEGDKLRITVPKQEPVLGAWLRQDYRSGPDGFKFKVNNLPELDSPELWLRGCEHDGTPKSKDQSVESFSQPLESLIPILKSLVSLGQQNPDKFGRLLFSNVPSTESGASESASSSSSLFVEFEHLKVVMTKTDSQLRIQVPKQSAAVGKYLYTARKQSEFYFETAGSPELRDEKLFLHGCNADGSLRDGSNAGDRTKSSSASTDSIKTILQALCSLGLSKPTIFGRLVGNNVGFAPTETSASSDDKFELETDKFHIRVTFPTGRYLIEILKQDRQIGAHLWNPKSYGSTEFEVWSHCYIRHRDTDDRKIMLGGIDSDKTLKTTSEGAVRKSDTCHDKTKVLSMLEDLRKYVIQKPEVFGTIIGSASRASEAAGSSEGADCRVEIKTPKLHLTFTKTNTRGVLEIHNQHKDVGAHFWSTKELRHSEFETYSTCGFPSRYRLRLGGVDSDQTLAGAAAARNWTGTVQSDVITRFQDLVQYISERPTLFGPIEICTGVTAPSMPEPAISAVPVVEFPTYSFKSENLEITVSSEHERIKFLVTKQTQAVTRLCAVGSRPKIGDISIAAAEHPEISSSYFFIAGKDKTLPVEKYQSASWAKTPQSTDVMLKKYFNILLQAAQAHPSEFGRILHTSWMETPTSDPTSTPTPTEAHMPTFLADPNTLTIETTGLRLEIKYLDSRTAMMTIPRQQSSIGAHLWSAKYQDSVRFEVDSDWSLRPGRLYLRPSQNSGRDLKPAVSHLFESAPKFSRTLEAMVALRKYIKANSEVFGSYIGDNLESVPAPPPPAPFDVTGMQHFVKFQNFHIGMSASSSEVSINIPVQTAEVTAVFQRELVTGTFTFKSVTQPEYKQDNPVIYVCGDQEDVTEATRPIRDSEVDHSLRIANALLELVTTASSIPEFGPLLATNVGPAALHRGIPAVAVPTEAAAEPSKYAALGMNMLAVNKTAAIIESKRQLGKVILGQAQSRVGENLPDLMKPIFNTPLGKILVANTLVVATEYYTGPHKDKVSVVTESVLSAAASDVGDWLDINGILDGFINAVKK